MLPATSACSIEAIENLWKKSLNDDLDFEGNNKTKFLKSKFQPRSPEFNDRIRILNLKKLLEMHMDENSKFKVMDMDETKKFLFNISLQINAMHSISDGLKKRFVKVLNVKGYNSSWTAEYMEKLWTYISYLYYPLKNDAIGEAFMEKLFGSLKNLLAQFPEILEAILKLEEQRDELIHLTKNIVPDVLSSAIKQFTDVQTGRIRCKEIRLETAHIDSPIINAITLFSKPIENIIDNPKDVPIAEIENTLTLIKTLENDLKNIFANKPFHAKLKEAEFCMGLLFEFDCLKFTYKALISIERIEIPATKDFTVTESEIIPILQVVVFLGESMISAAGIREKDDEDITIIRTLISLRNIVAHKMNAKKMDDYLWNGILKDLKELAEKIKTRLDFLERLFLEEDLLVDKKNEICLDALSDMPKMKMPKNKKKKSQMTEEEKVESLLQEPKWQNYNYKFLRSWLRSFLFKNYVFDDPLIEDIREVAKDYIDYKSSKPQHAPPCYYSFINSILKNVNKIEELSKNSTKTLAKKLQADSKNNDITLFLKLSYFLHQISQAFKDAWESANPRNKKDDLKNKKVKRIENWDELSQKLDKMGEHRLFEFLFTQIENARNLCFHSLWINESEYERFANVIHLVLNNLKPMLLRLSHREPVLLPGVYYFANSLIFKIAKMENIISYAFFTIRFRASVKECDSKMLAEYIKEDRQLKEYSKLHHFIIQIFDILQHCQLNNLLMWERFQSEIITLNQNRKFETIYTNLEFAKNITLRSLWKNNDEYRIFADTVLLVLNQFKPMLLELMKIKFKKWQKRRSFGKRLNYNMKQENYIFGQQKQFCKNTINFWWQLILIKCSVTPLTIKDHTCIINSDWVTEYAESITSQSQKERELYFHVKKIVTKLLKAYFRYRDKGSKKSEEKIIELLKKEGIISSDGFEENVSELIESFVKQFFECFKNLGQLDGWENIDTKFLDTKNLIQSLNKSFDQSTPEINLPGLHNRTPLLYVLGFHNPMAHVHVSTFDHIHNLVKILLNYGANPDKFSALTLHPLHYVSIITPALTQWFKEKCMFKNACEAFCGLNSAMILRNFQSLYSDMEDKDAAVDDTFFNVVSIADKIHHSFPNFDIVDDNYFFNLYDQNGKTPLICAINIPYLNKHSEAILEAITTSGANVNDKEIVSFKNGKPEFGESALKKVLKVEIMGHPWKIEKPQADLNNRKSIAEYLVSKGADKNSLKYFAANSLFNAIKTKEILLHPKIHETPEYQESIKNIDEIIEFWFEITVLLCEMAYDWEQQKFKNDQFKWITELLFGIKPSDIPKTDPSDSVKNSDDKKISEPISDLESIKNDSGTHIIEKIVPENQFLLLSNGELMIFDSIDDTLCWQYKFVPSCVVTFKKHSKLLLPEANFPLIFLKKRYQRKRRHFQRWRKRFAANVCSLISVIIVKDYFQCENCKKKNFNVTAQLKTSPDNKKYLETNEIQHVCKIQDLIKLERLYKQSDCEIDINPDGIQILTIIHATNKQWIFEFEYDRNLERFCCKKCKEYRHKIFIEFWKNRKEEDVLILNNFHPCYKLYEICNQSYYNTSLF